MKNEQQLREERLHKFKGMGVPTPIRPIDPATVQSAANPDKLAKLAAIKKGALREMTQKIVSIEKGNPNQFVALDVPKPKGNNRIQEQNNHGKIHIPLADIPKIKNAADSEALMMEQMLYGGGGGGSYVQETYVPEQPTQAPSPRNSYKASFGSTDDNGSDFLNDFKTRFANKTKTSVLPPRKAPNTTLLEEDDQSQGPLESRGQRGSQMINESEFVQSVQHIAADICKKMIKQVMGEFLLEQSSGKKGVIVESDKVKKAEIIREDLIKMNGKYYKIKPVTVVTTPKK
jgi:hypothetical protein